MQVSVRRGPSTVFLLTIFCFILPFVTLSCPGGKFTFTGLQLATGTTIQEPQIFGEPKEREIEANPLAAAALFCALAGFVVTFSMGRSAQTVTVLLGGGGALLMMFLKRRLDAEMLAQGQGMFWMTYEIGYWLTTLLFCVAAVLTILILRSSGEDFLHTENAERHSASPPWTWGDRPAKGERGERVSEE